MAVRRALAWVGASVAEAGNAREALELVLRTGDRFDCALLDYNLPDRSGTEMLRDLRAADADLPVIMMTGQGSEEIAVDAMKAGAADYLPKGRLSGEQLARSVTGAIRVHRAEAETRRAVARLQEETRINETLYRIGAKLSAERDVQTLLQTVTDEATALTGAQFGAFFYNTVNDRGESYTLYTLSGVPREAFSRFPMPRNTEIFAPTFAGTGVVRLDDVTADRRYGKSAPYHGMPQGHLPVRSYLAVPVTSRSGEVLGGLFFGHSQPSVFTERAERIVTALAAQAAVAIDNARLYQTSQREIAARALAEQELQQLNQSLEERANQRARELAASLTRLEDTERRFRLVVESVTDYAIYMLDPDGHVINWNPGAARAKGYAPHEVIGRHFSTFYTPEDKAADIPRDALRTATETGKFEAEGWRVRKDGSRFWASVIINAIKGPDGQILGFAKVTRDLTEKRAADERARQAQKMESVGQLTGG